MTDRDRRQEIESICDAALDMPIGDRDAFIASRCEGNEALRRDVEALMTPPYRCQ